MSHTTPRAATRAIRFLSVLLFLFVAWLFDFILSDIGNSKGPQLQTYHSEAVDPALVQREQDLIQETTKLNGSKNRRKEIQENLRASMEVAKETMEQMAGLHRLSLERGIEPSTDQSKAIAEAQQRYIQSQSSFEEANEKIADLNASAHALGQELNYTREMLEEQRKPAFGKWQRAHDIHEFKAAGLKLIFIVPVFLLGAFSIARRKDSLYRPIFMAIFVASFWQLGLVMHEHFPSEFFKYIAILAGIVIVMTFLVRTLQSAAKPQPAALLNRRREAYHKEICPACAYPFPNARATAYTCPSCGTGLFSACSSCGESRHDLLSFCSHCGSDRS